jgi:hypothetical protein
MEFMVDGDGGGGGNDSESSSLHVAAKQQQAAAALSSPRSLATVMTSQCLDICTLRVNVRQTNLKKITLFVCPPADTTWVEYRQTNSPVSSTNLPARRACCISSKVSLYWYLFGG